MPRPAPTPLPLSVPRCHPTLPGSTTTVGRVGGRGISIFTTFLGAANPPPSGPLPRQPSSFILHQRIITTVQECTPTFLCFHPYDATNTQPANHHKQPMPPSLQTHRSSAAPCHLPPASLHFYSASITISATYISKPTYAPFVFQKTQPLILSLSLLSKTIFNGKFVLAAVMGDCGGGCQWPWLGRMGKGGWGWVVVVAERKGGGGVSEA